MLRIRRDDLIIVTHGKDKGKTGRVMKVIPAQSRAIVENINLVKKAKRRTQQDQKGGIVEMEAPIHLSNLMLLDKETHTGTRFKIELAKDGTKIRLSKKSTAVI